MVNDEFEKLCGEAAPTPPEGWRSRRACVGSSVGGGGDGGRYACESCGAVTGTY
jgi:hypothetical protein